MPAVSKKQRMMMAIAEHNPEKLYKRNRKVLRMSKQQLHEYAASHPSAWQKGRRRG
jgi:hypothetical protein